MSNPRRFTMRVRQRSGTRAGRPLSMEG
jgi:hypothetical protein